jgi:eukaryotic-like serine/threonine-protein kinase
MKQVSQTPQRPSSINPRVSPALDAVVMRALEKDPGERFQSADAFIAALDAALREPGVGSGTAAFAALPPVVAVPLEEDPEEEEKRKRRRWIWIAVAVAAIIGVLIGLALTRDTTTNVPKVTGNELNVAISLLQQEGFSAEVNRVPNAAPANEVLEQQPLASPPADKAELDCSFLTFFCSKPKVVLTVSSGPGNGTVPGTSGLPVEEATEEIEKAGFVVKTEKASSNTVEEARVIHSEPPGGSSATNGSTVTLFVSSGRKQVKVPVLAGTQRSVAVQQIRGLGLVPSVSEEESSSPPGQVIRQSPNAGTKVPEGSTVSIVVAKGKKQVKVPNVIGKERREAVELVREAGLAPFVEEEETEVPSQVGRVVDQFPTPGSEQPPGTEVTLIVGKRASEAFPEEEEP